MSIPICLCIYVCRAPMRETAHGCHGPFSSSSYPSVQIDELVDHLPRADSLLHSWLLCPALGSTEIHSNQPA